MDINELRSMLVEDLTNKVNELKNPIPAKDLEVLAHLITVLTYFKPAMGMLDTKTVESHLEKS